MVGAVMLLMTATVGITYGWVPDGGAGVQYIIQIPPDKIEQVARSGEISSQIPLEIRGHVSEVVIRVGEGNVPRVTPNHVLSRGSGDANTVAAADQIPMPIPSMGDPTEIRPIGMATSPPTAMMKPAPQSGGMNMPGGFGMTPASTSPSTPAANTELGTTAYGSTGYANAPPASSGFNSSSFEKAAQQATDTFRNSYDAAREAGRQQIQQNMDAAVSRVGNAANAQVQSATNNLQTAANDLLYGPAIPPGTADDPRTRLTQGSSSALPPMPTTSAANGPSSSPYAASTNSPTPYANTPNTSSPASGYGTPPSFASAPPSLRSSTTGASSTSSPSMTNTRTATTPPLHAAVHDEEWYALNSGSGRRPSTTPVSSSGSVFDGGNFGKLPGGLQPSANSSSNQTHTTASTTNNLNYDPQLTPAQASALPKNGYSYDAEGYAVDRQGYRLNLYGQRVDRQGNVLPSVDASRDSELANASKRDPRANSSYANGQPQETFDRNSTTPPLVQPPRNRPAATGYDVDGLGADPESRFAGLNDRHDNASRRPSNGTRNDARPRSDEAGQASASDRLLRGERSDESNASYNGRAIDLDQNTEEVAAQPIFNALLLLSVVANIYLLFWLRNMREQFREMVAAKRASSSSSSLATGI